VFWCSETDERIPNKWWKKITLNQFVKHLKEQPKQRLTDFWSGAQQTVVDEAVNEWSWRSGLVSIQRGGIVNIYCNVGCRESSANMFMLNS